MNSASATAQSFALTTATHLSISDTLMRSPSSSHIWLPPMDAAAGEAETMSFGSIPPPSMASMIRSMVIIFVTLAGEQCSCAPFS